MGKIDSLLNEKRLKHEAVSSPQSKNSSLTMASLKSSIPIILEVRQNTHAESEFMDSVAKTIKEIFEKQHRLVNAVKLQAGGLSENEFYVWRRAFGIVSNGVRFSSFPSENFTLAILSRKNEAFSFCQKLGINSSEIKDLVTGVNRFNLYKDANSFYASTNASIMSASSKVEKEFRKINWSTSEVYARNMLAKAFSITAKELYKLCPDLINVKQQTMFQKSCINHSSRLLAHSLNHAGNKFDNTVGDYQIDEFEDTLMEELDLLLNCTKYCTTRIKESLSTFEEQHQASLLEEGNINMSVSDIFNAIESIQLFIPRLSNETPLNVTAKQFANTLNTGNFLTNYITQNIDQFITSINTDTATSFAHNTIFNSLMPEIKHIHFSDLNIDIRYLKMCANIAIYLTSEQPAKNETLNSTGLTESAINDFRKTRNLAFSIGLTSPFQNRQVIIPTVSELTRALIATNQFNWGINIAYLAPKIGKSILDATNRLYLDMAKRYESTNTSLFRACIQASSQCFVDTWEHEVSITLNVSKRKYGRGDITESEANQICDKIIARFMNNSHEHNATMQRLTSMLDESMTLHQNLKDQNINVRLNEVPPA